MPVCYIDQEEVYQSSPQDDRLNILEAETAINLEEDLNYIRSVILTILGLDKSNPDNKWYKVPPLYNFREVWLKLSQLEATVNYILGVLSNLGGSGSSGGSGGGSGGGTVYDCISFAGLVDINNPPSYWTGYCQRIDAVNIFAPLFNNNSCIQVNTVSL